MFWRLGRIKESPPPVPPPLRPCGCPKTDECGCGQCGGFHCMACAYGGEHSACQADCPRCLRWWSGSGDYDDYCDRPGLWHQAGCPQLSGTAASSSEGAATAPVPDLPVRPVERDPARYGSDMVKVGDLRRLGSDDARLRFGEDEKPEGAWAGRRLMFLDDQPAYELSFPCGTCQFLFRRLEGSNDTLPVEELRERLAEGTEELDDDLITSFGHLLGRGTYLPMLLTVQPRLVTPSLTGDYFAEEQLATWGVESFWGLPVYPGTAYYRTFETPVSPDAHLYEFLVPMVPPAWSDGERVAAYVERLSGSSVPTAVAVATLDVCAPAVAPAGSDWHEHWGLTHFLLDGHHKVLAAAEAQRPVRVLSLLAVESSLATSEQVARVPTLRQQRPDGRGRTTVAKQ